MIGAIKAVSTQRGRDPRAFALLAFGGSGPVHAAAMASLLEIGRVIVPPGPGLFSAFGLLCADHEHHATQTFFRGFSTLDLAELRAAVLAMEVEALAELEAEGYAAGRVRLERSADLRYVGQGFELLVPMGNGELGPDALAELEAGFHAEHERAYGHRSDGAPVQFVNLRLTARGLRYTDSPLSGAQGPHQSAGVTEEGSREAYFGPRGLVWTPVVGRASGLGAAPRTGPLIIEEYDATTVVPPGCSACLDQAGNIVVEVAASG
jgi:N-methylhydantoinase A